MSSKKRGIVNKQGVCFIALCVLLGGNIYAQDFGFGFDDEENGSPPAAAKPVSVSIGGEVSASMVGYIDDFSEGPDHVRLGDIFSGKLNFSAETSFAEGAINLKLAPSASPVAIDEAYVRGFFGGFDITAGMRKITWGKADSLGPLDVVNPLDYSQIFIEMADNVSLMGVKIARPLVHAAFRFGNFSKIEGVFVPWFQPHRIPRTGIWAASQMEMLILADSFGIVVGEPDTGTLEYAQAGLRYTTTVGGADIGAQYYYGRLPQPSVGISFIPSSLIPLVDILYNPYHQIGLDYAQVLFGFNTRAEFAANITEDLEGDNGSIYNPSVLWSFGFDRDLFLNVNLNLQINESIRMRHDKLAGKFDMDNPLSILSGNFDIEGGSELTATRLTASLSRKFLRDELELRAALVWGMEDRDCAFLPALIWSKNDIRFALSGCFFTGNSDGQLGQYRDNNFLKIALAYTF
ncbi:MAG: hypothetical protein FWH38_01620 [Treponema sp.]|nr:hypothetical protein [Treponema sp.]